MLPAPNRMRSSSDFTATVRGGRRSRGTRTLVVHHRRRDAGGSVSRSGPALVGLVVGRSVGNSVVRHRVSRRLRAQLASRLDRLPVGSRTVVRALPPSGSATSQDLARDLDRALDGVIGAEAAR